VGLFHYYQLDSGDGTIRRAAKVEKKREANVYMKKALKKGKRMGGENLQSLRKNVKIKNWGVPSYLCRRLEADSCPFDGREGEEGKGGKKRR